MNRIAPRGWLGWGGSDRRPPGSRSALRVSLSSWAKRSGFEGPMDRVTRWN